MTVIDAKKNFLTRIVHADGVVKRVELKTVLALLGYSIDERNAETAALMSQIERGQLKGNMTSLLTLSQLPMDRKLNFVRMMWLAALCDGDLHAREEAMIFNIATALEVSRNDVIKLKDEVL